MVIVIGKRCKNVSPAAAGKYVFGVTCGNDISTRFWQKNDVQWWRAKASDTFGSCSPFIASGLNYDDLTLELRLNGKVRQKEQTSYLIQMSPKWSASSANIQPWNRAMSSRSNWKGSVFYVTESLRNSAKKSLIYKHRRKHY